MADLTHEQILGQRRVWAIVAPLLPRQPAEPKGGRPRVADRACLTGVDFVLKSGIHWERLPQKLAWRIHFRRLRVRAAHRPEIHDACLTLGCALICFKALS